MTTTKLFMWAIACASILVGLLAFTLWNDTRDKALMQSARAYEACVVREYGMTPVQWYIEQGAYPDCD